MRSQYESHDFLRSHPLHQHRSPSPALVAEANARVRHWRNIVGRRFRFQTSASRSVTDLTELKEEDEDEALRKWVWSGGVV